MSHFPTVDKEQKFCNASRLVQTCRLESTLSSLHSVRRKSDGDQLQNVEIFVSDSDHEIVVMFGPILYKVTVACNFKVTVCRLYKL